MTTREIMIDFAETVIWRALQCRVSHGRIYLLMPGFRQYRAGAESRNPFRYEDSAALWLNRLQPQQDNTVQAFEIAALPKYERRRAMLLVRDRVYRRAHRPRAEMPRALRDVQAKEIREACYAGQSRRALAKQYGVSAANIALILSGATYRHAGGPLYWPSRGWFTKESSAGDSGNAVW